jgi:Na+-driven multidrug efflux pump
LANKITFFKKLKLIMNVGKKPKEIKCSFAYVLVWHAMNYLFIIFLGWVGLAYYIGEVFGDLLSATESTIMAWILMLIVNWIYVIIVPCEENTEATS